MHRSLRVEGIEPSLFGLQNYHYLHPRQVMLLESPRLNTMDSRWSSGVEDGINRSLEEGAKKRASQGKGYLKNPQPFSQGILTKVSKKTFPFHLFFYLFLVF